VQIGLAAEGYDPIMHYDRGGAPAFVFDMMEPQPSKVSRAVLHQRRCIQRISGTDMTGPEGLIRN
jgi:hypothetical protein